VCIWCRDTDDDSDPGLHFLPCLYPEVDPKIGITNNNFEFGMSLLESNCQAEEM